MTGYYKKHAETLYSAGYEPLPLALRAKWPDKSIDAWSTVPITREQVQAWSANGKGHGGIGIRTGEIVGVDIDIYDAEVAAQIEEDFVARFGQAPKRIGQAPKCLYVFRASDVRSKITSAAWARPNAEPGEKPGKIEILAKGQQFVAMNIHPATGKEYTWPNGSILDLETWELPELDMDLVADWVHNVVPTLIPASWERVGAAKQSNAKASDDAFANYKPPLDITEEEVREYLTCLDPSGAYEDWLEVMMACHHQFGGSGKGYEVFAQWSRSASSHNDPVERARWAKMHADFKGARLTFATVIKRARESDKWKEVVAARANRAFDEWAGKVKGCGETHALEHLVGEIATDPRVSAVDQTRLVDVLRSRFGDLGVVMTKTEVKDIIKKAARTSRSGAVGAPARITGADAWCAGYVWVKADDCFVHGETQEVVSVQSFNAAHGRDVKGRRVTPDGQQQSAAHVALHELQVPVVERRMYLPCADAFFELEGLNYINTYRPSSVPRSKAPLLWGQDDQEAVERMQKHLQALCAESYGYVLWWLAHNVQRPGVKIRHTPLIKGIEGDGKSLIGNLLSVVMGPQQVRVISPKVLLTDFNGWAEGQAVGVFEEVRIPGHNRHDAMNAIKPLITNDAIPIHRKGRDEYNVINTTNYIAFTNYANALPLTDTDRRWHIIFSPWGTIQALHAALGEDHFDVLFDAIENHKEALRGWLMNEPLDAFDRNGRAPDSAAKQAMIAAARPEEDQLIMDVIEAGAIGVTNTVISTKHLTDAVLMNPDAGALHTRALAASLERVGFSKYPKQVKWKNEPCRVWVRSSDLTKGNEWVRRELDLSVTSDDLLGDDTCPF